MRPVVSGVKYALILFPCLLELVHAQMIVGHRGASHDAPENTIAAFKEAWQQGADGVEGDFYLTRDLQIVCIHDKDTKRTAGRRLLVGESTLAELRDLEYGAWKSARFRGEPLPTLEDVLEVIPEGKKFVIELKVGPEIVPHLAERLRAASINSDNILIISFNEDTVLAAKTALPKIKAHWLTSYKTQANGTIKPNLASIASTLQKCKADGLGSKGDRAVLTKSFIEGLRARGMSEFHVWTIDSVEDALYFQQLGAMGITTNRPAVIRQGLGEP